MYAEFCLNLATATHTHAFNYQHTTHHIIYAGNRHVWWASGLIQVASTFTKQLKQVHWVNPDISLAFKSI